MAQTLLGLLALWALSGVLIGWFASRQGHNAWLMMLIGLGYGPFTSLVFLLGFAGQTSTGTRTRAGANVNEEGWIDVLVGIDGSADSVTSARQVLDVLGDAVHRLCIASVLDHEISNTPDGFELDDSRWEFLQNAAARLGHPHAELALESGRPDKALDARAQRDGFDLVIVAHRDQPVRSGLAGSTVARLARRATVPVLIGPPA